MLFSRNADWNAVRDHVSLLNGARIANFIAERRLDFFYLGNPSFTAKMGISISPSTIHNAPT